jgi:hypothetical protein
MSDIRARDARIASWLSDGPTALPLHVRTAVVDGLRTTPRARRSRLAGETVHRRRVLLVAAALLVAALAAAAMIGSRLLERQPEVVPELGPRETAELVVSDVRTTPFTYRLPVGLGLVREDSPAPGLGYVSFTTGGPPPYGRNAEAGGTIVPTARGIVIADLTDVTFHGSLEVRVLRTSTPLEFLSDLDAGPEFMVRNAVPGRLGSFEGLVADVRLDQPREWTHVDIVAGSIREGSLDFSNPSRLYLAEVGDLLVAVQVWAPTAPDLEDWLPIAAPFVDSLEFPGSAPAPTPATTRAPTDQTG